MGNLTGSLFTIGLGAEPLAGLTAIYWLSLKNPRGLRKEFIVSRRIIALGVVASAILAAAPVLADTLYSQPHNFVDAYEADSGEINADNFTLGANSIVNGIVWSGFSSAATPTTFTVTFYSSTSGAPGTEVASYDVTPTVTDTGSQTVYPGSSFETYDYTASLPSTLLSGSTEYFVSITADGLGTDPNYWFWATGSGGPGDGFYYSYTGGAPFSLSDTSEDLSFTLDGSVGTPEPSSLALVGTGVLAAAGMLRRRFVRA